MVFLQHFIIFVSLVLEEGSLDLGALAVNKFYVEDGSFSFSILPGLLGMLLSDSSLDLPVKKEGIQTLNRSILLL